MKNSNHPIFWCLLFVGVMVSERSWLCAEEPPAVEVNASIDHDIIDTLPLGDGRVVYLTSRGPYLPKDNGEPVAYETKSDVREEFTRLFRDPRDEAAFYATALLGKDASDGLVIYRFTADNVRMAAFTRERLREPNFHQSPDGEVFVSSRTGVIYRFDGEELRRSGLPWPQGERISFQKMFRRLDFASWPGGPTCVYSVADREFHKLALFDLLVTTESGWKTIPLNQPFTGPGCMSDARTFRMLLFDRWVNVDLQTGKVTEIKFSTPGEAADKLRATKVVAMRDGTLVSIWRRPFRSFKKYDVDPFDDGTYHRVAIWRDDHWELAPVGIDRQLYRPENHVIDEQGGLWLLGGEGTLAYRSPEGKWREFTHRHGLLTQGVMQMTLDARGRLLLTYGNWAVTKVDTAKLLAQADDPTMNWHVFYTQQSIGLQQFGDAPPLLTTSGEVVAIGPRGVRRFALPDAETFPVARSDITVSVDADGVVRLASKDQRHFAKRQRDGWAIAKPPGLDGGVAVPPSDEELKALSSDEVKQGVFDSSPLQPFKWCGFRPHGRALAGDETRLAYFDGEAWSIAPLAGCPFYAELSNGTHGEFGSAHGRWVIEQKIGYGTYRYAIYDPPGVQIRQSESDLGKVDSHEAELKPHWTAEHKLSDATLRYRVDTGPWSAWQAVDQPIRPGAIAPPGKHFLHVELHSLAEILNDPALEYQFNVAYDIRGRIEELVKQLGADDFAARNQATRQLQSLGPLVHDYVREVSAKQTDPEIQFRLRQVLGEN